ncbi:MAG: sugar phosphate isomerase/epimerase [Candidatus Lokiarchaeota archaeon]|nr:sugar phosphate isomerase/epimerase [Candidatus Lokiarchaeota archaeon]
MLLGLNQNSCKNLTTPKFIKKAKRFQGIELNFEKINNEISDDLSLANLLEYLEMYNTKLINLYQLEDFSLCSDREFKTTIIPTLRKLIYYCYNLECDLITITPSFESRDIPKWRIIRKTENRLKEIIKIAYREDIRIGFEFISQPDSSIKNLSETKNLLSSFTHQENLGYVLDTYHLGKTNEEFENIIDIIGDIYLIQLSDLINTLEDTKDSPEIRKRIFPGEGEFNFKKFLNLTKKYRYKDFFSIELNQNKCQIDYYKKFLKLNSPP